MTERLSIALRARRGKGEPVRKEEFLGPLGLQEHLRDVVDDPELRSARLELSSGLSVDEGLRRATKWLGGHEPAVFDHLRSIGLLLDLEIVAHGEGLRLRLPVALLAACGRRGLPISVLSPKAVEGSP